MRGARAWSTEVRRGPIRAAIGMLLAGREGQPHLDLPRPEPSWHGEYISIAVDGVDVCEGSLQAMDQKVELISAVLGARADVHVTAYILSAEELFENGTCHAAGCTWRSEVWSLYAPAGHELAHAVRGQIVGWEELVDTPPVLEEGLAEVLADGWTGAPDPSPITEVLEPQPDGVPFKLGGYQRAGHFVRFLIDRWSLPVVLELSRRAASVPLARALEDILGQSLDDVLAAYASHPWCSRNNWRMPLLECSGDPLPWTSATPRALRVAFDLACDEHDWPAKRAHLSDTHDRRRDAWFVRFYRNVQRKSLRRRAPSASAVNRAIVSSSKNLCFNPLRRSQGGPPPWLRCPPSSLGWAFEAGPTRRGTVIDTPSIPRLVDLERPPVIAEAIEGLPQSSNADLATAADPIEVDFDGNGLGRLPGLMQHVTGGSHHQ